MAYRVYTQIVGSQNIKTKLQEISEYIIKSEVPVDRFIIDGRMTRLDPERILTFNKGIVCICCGLEGTILSSERMIGCTHKMYGKAHLNIYGMRGTEKVMLTVDHIELRSKGGDNNHSNYNTMCKDCNTRRGNSYEKLEDFLEMCKKYPIERFLHDKELKKKRKEEKQANHEARRKMKAQ